MQSSLQEKVGLAFLMYIYTIITFIESLNVFLGGNSSSYKLIAMLVEWIVCIIIDIKIMKRLDTIKQEEDNGPEK